MNKLLLASKMSKIKKHCDLNPELDIQMLAFCKKMGVDESQILNVDQAKKCIKHYNKIKYRFPKKMIQHTKKPDCKICIHEITCDKHYKTCKENTGFITPCDSCYKIGKCKMYLVSCKNQKPIYECPYWMGEKS